MLAARAAREAGGGRSAQLTLALALLTCPLIFRLAGADHEIATLPLFAFPVRSGSAERVLPWREAAKIVPKVDHVSFFDSFDSDPNNLPNIPIF